MKVAHVILDIQTQALDQAYTYLVPEALQDFEGKSAEVQVGCAVLVPFGHRDAVGFVVSLGEEEPELELVPGTSSEPLHKRTSAQPLGKCDGGSGQQACLFEMTSSIPVVPLVDSAGSLLDVSSLSDEPKARYRIKQKYKPIKQVLSVPYFTEAGADTAQFLAERYIAPLSNCVRLFTPPGAVPKLKLVDGHWQVLTAVTREVDDRWVVLLPEAHNYQPRKNAAKQIAILAALEQGDLRVADLTAEYGNVASTLKALQNKGVVRVESRRRYRGGEAGSAAFEARVKPRPQLTDEQRHAVEAIRQAVSQHDGHVVVVDGVTGSGKTEIYLHAIEEVLAQGENAIVLVPEISLTPQTVARFRGRFGDTVAVLHSRMGNGERFDQWDLIRTGAARVVVGARSALFAPVPNVGLIVIDEEHEGSYKQDQAPRYVTRDVAAWMARRAGATLVLGSATPSIEALHACATDPRWTKVELHHRANGKPLPPIQIADMSREFGKGNRRMFSKVLREALFQELDAGHKVVLMLNQRGFAQFLLCRDCGFVPVCEDCSTSLTYHQRGNLLVCHHCGRTWTAPVTCPVCGSPYLKKFGAGTQRVEDELAYLLEGREVDIIRMDADTTQRKGDHQRLLERFATAERAVLLGTQMIAKGLDFDEVTLVGVINADTMLKLPDFRASERTFDLLSQVAGRCGRGALSGRVIVQTYNPSDRSIQAAAHYDREAFLTSELELRQGLGYPPYERLANVLVWGKDLDQVKAVGHQLFAALRDVVVQAGCDDWTVLPATPCVLEKLKGTYRYHLLIKAPAAAELSQVLLPYFRTRKPHPQVNVAVDIDPVSLL